MEWRSAQSVEDLKVLGNLKETAKYIEGELGGQTVPKGSWAKLLVFVQGINGIDVPREQKKDWSWDTVESSQQLSKLGSLKDVKAKMQERFPDKDIKARSWEQLYGCLKVCVAGSMVQTESYQSPFFKDEVSELIFYIVELRGEARFEKLGVTKQHFKDLKVANAWKLSLLKKIHPDQTQHIYAEAATKELNEMYGSMIQFAK